ncbi:RNA polymerase sigma-70 factor [Chitinophaga horti]|uniref:RNA polymerase sigma-70 factor n=1 Tax=Chitinophaga horti TaxID=2920382 RepID=A0ABY6J3P9_9BACT|nr:RNA polymerase sigma-70 factor [Chitinophaga horti]UYQ94305.1 RNA polymerase sigma-70 factor [Chitinophaga horti]
MTVVPLVNENALFRQIAAGDEEAFREIYYHYYPKLYGFINSLTKVTATTEEILQETFTRLWEHRESVAGKGYSAPWLFRVASNLAYDHLKNSASRLRLYERIQREQAAPSSNNVTDHINERQHAGLLEEAIRQLPEQRQIIFRLSREEGLSHQEIADRLQISPNTVKNQMVKALKSVRSFMESASRILLTILW